MKPSTNLQFSTHADRLFIQLGHTPVIGRRGLPSKSSVWSEVNQHEWSHWDAVPCVLLLGEPGSGKTSEFLHRFSQLNESAQVAFISRWQDWCEGDDIFATLNDDDGFIAALEDAQTVWWFIDALDEGRIKTEQAFNVIKKGLKELKKRGVLDKVRLRISCRSRDWRPNEANQLKSFFPAVETEEGANSSVVTLQLLPLDEVAVRTLALEKLGTQEAVNRFMDTLIRRHVAPLAGQPLLLAMMLQMFQHDDETLGCDRTSLYEQAVKNLNTEHNNERKDQAPPQTMPARRISIAQRLSVHAVFGGKDAIAVPDIDSGNDRTLDAACSDADRKEILETLNTGLFTQHASNGFCFLHRSFAEFMAAVALSEQIRAGLPLARILPLFPVEHEVIPGPLRETAAWLAGLDVHFRNWLISHDPITAAQGDTVRYTPKEREELITILAKRFVERSWQRDFDRFGDLARSVADNVLCQLLQSGNSIAVRHMAMDMIDAAVVESLYVDLLQVALDGNAESVLRTRAATILASREPTGYADKLYPLLNLPADQDMDDEISGALLFHLYPNHLTTAQALSALHIPHKHSFYGLYRHFWEHEFLERKPPSRAERELILNAIVPLLKDDEDSIALRSLTEIFTKLLREELIEKDPEVVKFGPWLIKLAGWNRHRGIANEAECQQLIQTLRAKPQLRNELLRWQLGNWPKGKDFNLWWHFPYFDSITTDDDLPVFVEMCRKYSGTPEIGARIFDVLINIAHRPPHSIKLEIIEALAETNSDYERIWMGSRVRALDDPAAQIYREDQEYKIERVNREVEEVLYFQSNIEALRTGNCDLILDVAYRAHFEVFGDAPIEAIKAHYGVGVAQAVHEGLTSIWNNLKGIPSLWPYSNELPNMAIAAGFGYRLQQPQLESLNEHQIDYLVWCMLHQSNEASALLTVLWEYAPSAVWLRLVDSIARESAYPEESHPMVWQRLNSFGEMPVGLMDELVNYIIKEGMPLQAYARQYALKILLRSTRRDEVLSLVCKQVNSDWCGQTLPSPWFEYGALSALAAWWLLDADSTFDVLANVVLQGSRHSPRAIGFINGFQELQDNYSAFNSKWPDSISWQNYAKLLPLLYAQPPCAELKLGGGRVTPSDQFAHARDSLVSHISKAPPHLANAWFGAWKEDARFGVHRDWFANIHAELIQRQADESWSPLSIEMVKQVFVGQASLVRNENDVMLLLNEVIEQELIPAFRSDYSMVSVLYSGTKMAGRAHLEEQALQTVIIGQLMPIVRAKRIIGAREPEVFDAKKPDARLTCILDSGAIVDIPVEVKWADHAELWSAIDTQLLKKYMQDSRVRYGIYFVGWIGPEKTTRGASGEKPATPILLQSQLQAIANLSVAGTDKKISVYVLDASLHD